MSEDSSGYWRGLITGVIIGAAAALLLAPTRGDEIRHDLSAGASKVKDRAADLSGTVAETARDLKDRGQDLVSTARSKVAGAADADESVQSSAQAGGESAETRAGDPMLNGQSHDVVESV
jgi:gas vesicle protein